MLTGTVELVPADVEHGCHERGGARLGAVEALFLVDDAAEQQLIGLQHAVSVDDALPRDAYDGGVLTRGHDVSTLCVPPALPMCFGCPSPYRRSGCRTEPFG